MGRVLNVENIVEVLEKHKDLLDRLDPIVIAADNVWGKVVVVHCYYGDEEVQEWFKENKEKAKIENFRENEYFKISIEFEKIRIFALLSENELKEFGGVENE